MRATRRDPLAGLRWLQRSGLRLAYSGFGKPSADYDGQLLAERHAERPQGERGHRGTDGERAGTGRRQGPGMAALSRKILRQNPDGRGSRRVRERSAQGAPRQERGPDSPAGGSAAVPDVLEWHDGQAQGRAAWYRGIS